MGEIVTFYSYKGGTGRTMSLANTAALAARDTDGPVLMIDWDLEAPGLSHYFEPYAPDDMRDRAGLFSLVESANEHLPMMAYGEEDEGRLSRFFAEEVGRLLIPLSLPGSKTDLYLMKAGLVDKGYTKRINQFSWSDFYKKIPGFFPFFAKYLAERFSTVFIDSRTGHTDIGGICTMVMPDKLVMVFTPNDQSLNGVLEVARTSADYRIKYDNEMRPLLIYPLPSRIDFSGVSSEKRERWQGDYEEKWEAAFQDIYGLPPTISLKGYFANTYLRHDSNYAFGEELAVLLDLETPESIAQDYRRFTTALASDKIWEDQPFANMAAPFEVVFAFAADDGAQVEKLKKHLGPLQQRSVLQWSERSTLPVEAWDPALERKIASGEVDFVLVLLSAAMLQQEGRWKKTLEAAQEKNAQRSAGHRVIPILLEPLSLNGHFQGYPVFPGRSKALSEWPDQEAGWQQVVALFRREAIKLNQHKQGTWQHNPKQATKTSTKS